MLKEIRYKGVSLTPSDYECTDGELMFSDGITIEGGGIRSVGEPKILSSMPKGFTPMYIHKTDKYKNYIGTREDGVPCWLKDGDGTYSEFEIQKTSGSVLPPYEPGTGEEPQRVFITQFRDSSDNIYRWRSYVNYYALIMQDLSPYIPIHENKEEDPRTGYIHFHRTQDGWVLDDSIYLSDKTTDSIFDVSYTSEETAGYFHIPSSITTETGTFVTDEGWSIPIFNSETPIENMLFYYPSDNGSYVAPSLHDNLFDNHLQGKAYVLYVYDNGVLSEREKIAFVRVSSGALMGCIVAVYRGAVSNNMERYDLTASVPYLYTTSKAVGASVYSDERMIDPIGVIGNIDGDGYLHLSQGENIIEGKYYYDAQISTNYGEFWVVGERETITENSKVCDENGNILGFISKAYVDDNGKLNVVAYGLSTNPIYAIETGVSKEITNESEQEGAVDNGDYITEQEEKVRTITSMGNILMLATDRHLHYLIFRNDLGKYRYLGNRLPSPEMTLGVGISFLSDGVPETDGFGIKQTLYTYESHTAELPSGVDFAKQTGEILNVGKNGEDSSAVVALNNAVYGCLNKVTADIKDNGLIGGYYLVRPAIRLYNGDYIPTASPVAIGVKQYENLVRQKGYFGRMFYAQKLAGELRYYIYNLTELKKWSDIVKGIGLFISDEIYTYDPDKNVTTITNDHIPLNYFPDANTREKMSDCHSFYKLFDIDLDPESENGGEDNGLSGLYRMRVSNVPVNAEGVVKSDGNISTEIYGEDGIKEVEIIYSYKKGQTIKSIAEGWKEAFNENGYQTIDGFDVSHSKQNEDHVSYISLSSFYIKAWKGKVISHISVTYDYNNGYLSCGCDRVFGGVAFSTQTNLSASLTQQKTLDDSFRFCSEMIPECFYSFNSRINMGSITQLPSDFPLTFAINNPFTPAIGGFAGDSFTDIWFYVDTDYGVGIKHKRIFRNGLGSMQITNYLFYEDPRCYRAVAKSDDGKYYNFPMKKHDFLWGSVFCSSVDTASSVKPYLDETIVRDPKESVFFDLMTNQVAQSDVNNPFVFRSTGFYVVGTENIRALSSATKAMSQGQFGQFNVYAFCSDGVFALDTKSDGTYNPPSPVTRDVYNGNGLVQTDDSVIFTTDNGLVNIFGSQSENITNMFRYGTFKTEAIDAVNDVLSKLNLKTIDASFDPMHLFRNAHLAYDYTTGRIIASYGSGKLSLCFSMESKEWTINSISFDRVLNSYPYTEIVCNGIVKTISETTVPADGAMCLIVTRPIKFDEHDVLKSVRRVYQRGTGINASTSMKQVILGSRDLDNWFVVSSSSKGIMDGFSGTAYKYYIFVVSVRLKEGDRIVGLSADIVNKYTSRLR